MASKICAQAKCKQPATEAVGNSGLCDRHYKIYQEMFVQKTANVGVGNSGDAMHRCPTIHDAIREGRIPTTAEMDSTCESCRLKLVAQCSKCQGWHHFEGTTLKNQMCVCGSTDFITSSLVSERTWNPLRKAKQ